MGRPGGEVVFLHRGRMQRADRSTRLRSREELLEGPEIQTTEGRERVGYKL